MRKLLSVLCAVVIALSLVVTASAYPTNPGYSQPSGSGTAAAKAVVDGNAVADAIQNAGDNDVIVINITNDAQLQKEALAAIANLPAGTVVIFKAANFSIMIRPEDVTDAAKAIDLGMTITNKNGNIEINPKAQGAFGFAFTIVIPAANIKSSGLNTSALKAYHVADNGKVTKLPSKLNEDGSFSLKVNHASYYVITDENLADDGDDDDDFDLEDDDDTTTNGTNITTTSNNESDETNTSSTSSSEGNPYTGVAFSFIAAGAAGLVTLVSKKSKK